MSKYQRIDSIDRQILLILQNDARTSNAEIARQVGLTPSAVLERIKKLEDKSAIRGFAARLDPNTIGYGLTAFVFVKKTCDTGDTDQRLAEIPQVLEVHEVAGEDCVLMKVCARDTADMSRLLREEIKILPNIVSTKTTIVLQTIKETNALPIDSTDPVD